MRGHLFVANKHSGHTLYSTPGIAQYHNFFQYSLISTNPWYMYRDVSPGIAYPAVSDTDITHVFVIHRVLLHPGLSKKKYSGYNINS